MSFRRATVVALLNIKGKRSQESNQLFSREYQCTGEIGLGLQNLDEGAPYSLL